MRAKADPRLKELKLAASIVRQYVVHDSCSKEFDDDATCDCGLDEALERFDAALLTKKAPTP